MFLTVIREREDPYVYSTKTSSMSRHEYPIHLSQQLSIQTEKKVHLLTLTWPLSKSSNR